MRKLGRLIAAFVVSFGVGLFLPDMGTAGTSAYLVGKKPIRQPTGAAEMCTRYAWACASDRTMADFDDAQLRLARRVNLNVNRQTPQIADRKQYASAEMWALPTRRGGDCEDFALLKKLQLMRAGIPGGRLLIATVLDRNRKGHAVLVVRTHRGDLVLDNLTNRVLRWDKTGYTFLKMQNPRDPGRWDAILEGGILTTTASIPAGS